MEQNGFHLDTEFCNEAAGRARDEEAVCLVELDKWLDSLGVPSGVNWASPVQLVKLFHETLGLPPSPVWKKGRVKVDAGERKLDEAALDYIRNRSEPQIRRGIDELVRLRRLRGSIKYLTKLPLCVAPDGLVHPVTGPASDGDSRSGTITWRLAVKIPEVQQIPEDPKKDWFRIRRAFIAPPGHSLVVADEKALEIVILAHLLIKLFDDHQLADMVAPDAPDIHSVNARLVFGTFLRWERYGKRVDEFPPECFQSDDYPELKRLRQDIKAVWYGLMYGKTDYGFATSLRDAHDNPIGIDAAGKIVAALYEAVRGIPKYQGFISAYIREHHGVPGLSGAWCDLSELTKSGNPWDLKRAERVAQNYPMQQGGARIIGWSMVRIMEDPELDASGLTLERQVHDELDFRLPDTAIYANVKGKIEEHMTSYPLLSPLQVKIGRGPNWDDAKN